MEKVLVLNVKEQTFKEVELPKDFRGFYPLLDCGTFDIVNRRVGGKRFDVYCDDEGILKTGNPVSAIIKDEDGLKPMLFGNLVFTRTNRDGETIGISDNDIEAIKAHSRKVRNLIGQEMLVVGMDW